MKIPTFALILWIFAFLLAAGKLFLLESRVAGGEPFNVIGLEYECRSTKGKSAFDKRFCVQMLDVQRIRDYACTMENKDFGCSPANETIDKAIFELCGYK